MNENIEQTNDIIDCPKCNSAISSFYKRCPYCNYKINNFQQKAKRFYNDLDKNCITITLMICIVFLILSISYNGHLVGRNYESVKKINSLEEEIESVNKKYTDITKENDKLSKQISDIKTENSNIKNELKNAEIELSNSKTNFNELQEKYKSLETENQSLKQKLEEQKKIETAESSVTSNDTDDIDYETTVYWTPNGKVYHYSRNCPTLKRSSSISSGSISSSGRGRSCKVCG